LPFCIHGTVPTRRNYFCGLFFPASSSEKLSKERTWSLSFLMRQCPLIPGTHCNEVRLRHYPLEIAFDWVYFEAGNR
jgi:hypothetical protein